MSCYVTRGSKGPARSVLRLPPARGRDFVCGDVHGALSLLAEALTRLRFNPRVDRLILCGDLVDRGEQSPAAADLLSEAWVFSVRGNHEQMLLDGYEHGGNEWAAELSLKNGGRWFLGLSAAEKARHLAAYRALPLVIEVPTEHGLVGIVHAEVPYNQNWQQFTTAIEHQDEVACDSALWGRNRVKYRIAANVEGIWRVFCGHTLRPSIPQWLGNVCFLDTGAQAGWKAGASSGSALSVVNIIASQQATVTPTRIPLLNLVDA